MTTYFSSPPEAVRIVVTYQWHVNSRAPDNYETGIGTLDVTRHRRQQLIGGDVHAEFGGQFGAEGAVQPQRLGDSDNLEAHALYLKGEALRSAERYQEAVIELHRAADAAPDDIHIWLSLGWCYKRTDHIALAIQSLDEALAVEPGEALIHYNLACYWSLAGNSNRALEFLATAFDIDSNYRDIVDGEPDLDPIRSDPGFLALTSVIV